MFLHLVATCVPLTAQVTVFGTISESVSNEVVIGATVSLYRDSISPGKKPERGAYTNRYGYYAVKGISSGRYTMVVTSVGYRTYVHTITIGDDTSDIRVDVSLENASVTARDVVVTADREESAIQQISTVTITPDFIKDMPSLGGEADVFRVLQLLPGVKSASEISSGLYIRGGSPDQNLILLDGVVVYNPSHLGGFLSSFHADALRDVKLIKGAMPAEYGGRLAAVVDITMKEGNSEQLHGAAHVSLIAAGITFDGPIDSTMTFMVSGRRFYGDLLAPLFIPPDELPTYYFYDLNLKINKRFGNSDRLFVSGYFGRDVLGAPPSDYDNFDVNWGNATANIRWTHVIQPELFASASAIYTDYRFGFDAEESNYDRTIVTRFASASHIRDITVRGDVEWVATNDHFVKAGVDVTHHRFASGVTGDVGQDIDQVINSATIDAVDASLFIQDEWKINDVLRTNIGGRLYYFNSGGWFRVEPRVNIAWDLAPTHSLTGSFAIANQFLHLIVRNDLALPTDVWFPSTSAIPPSQSVQGVMGYQKTFEEGMWLFTVETYYKSMSNLLEYKEDAQFTLGVPLESQFTSGSGEAYGLELFLNKRLGDFTGWIGYTLSWSKRTFPELNNGKTFAPRYDRRHDISVTVQYRLWSDFKIAATWVYGTGQAYTVPSGQYNADRLDQGDPNNPDHTPTTQELYTERNAFRLAPFHKLDLNFVHEFTMFGLASEFIVSIYNAYNRLNPFALYTSYDYDNNSNSSQRVIKQITLFPIIPSLGLRVKF